MKQILRPLPAFAQFARSPHEESICVAYCQWDLNRFSMSCTQHSCVGLTQADRACVHWKDESYVSLRVATEMPQSCVVHYSS
jgi:hypothetical protein